jgi:hypothetical protein
MADQKASGLEQSRLFLTLLMRAAAHTISQSVVERMVVSLVAHLIDSPCFSTSSDRCCDTSKGMRPLVLRRLIHRALV